MTSTAAIAISMRTTLSAYGEVRDEVSESLVMFVAKAGFLPIVVPNCPSVAHRLMAQTVGLVLSGGSEPVTRSTLAHSRRQETERVLLELAIARNVPVLGICRGAQVINAYFGGLTEVLEPPAKHVAAEHTVRINPSKVASLLDPFMWFTVNSFHGQSITRIGAGLLAAAFAPDGQVEAIEHVRRPIVGLMWHPERACSAADFAKAHAPLLERLMAWRGGPI